MIRDIVFICLGLYFIIFRKANRSTTNNYRLQRGFPPVEGELSDILYIGIGVISLLIGLCSILGLVHWKD